VLLSNGSSWLFPLCSTLECILYFVKNLSLTHRDYVKQAGGKVPTVFLPSRRDLTGFLEGKTAKKDLKDLDPSAPLQMPANYKRPAEDKAEGMSAAKKARTAAELAPTGRQEKHDAAAAAAAAAAVEELQKGGSSLGDIKKRLADKLDAPQEKAIVNKELKNLSKDLTTDKIAEIRAKLISNRRTRIKPEDADDVTMSAVGAAGGDQGARLAAGLASMEVDGQREGRDVFGRERVWRTRSTILQSSGKTFSKTVTAILASIKAREEGRRPGAGHMAPPPSVMSGGTGGPPSSATPRPGAPPQRQTLPNYNRYDQEQFRGKEDTHGFNIETTGTFSGMTLKSVTEGSQANRNKQAVQPGQARGAPGAFNGAPKSGASPGQGGSGGGSKRLSRTPIIIIPAAPKSLITMYNAKEILQDLRFVSTEDKKNRGAKRENDLLIQRRKEVQAGGGKQLPVLILDEVSFLAGGLTVPYRGIDNPGKLTNADWDRVVAVFVMGQAWQFKGWPWDGNPTNIFSKSERENETFAATITLFPSAVAAYHLKWEDSSLEGNIGKWAVKVIPLSREKRHLDRAKLMSFWETLDRYMVNHKPHLRF